MRGRTRVHMRIGALPTDRDCREWTLVLYHMTRPGPEYIQREEALRGPRCRGTLHGPHDCKVWQWGRCRMGEEAKVSATQEADALRCSPQVRPPHYPYTVGSTRQDSNRQAIAACRYHR